MKEFLCNTAAALAVVAVVWLLVIMALTSPEGLYDRDTRVCIAVENRSNDLVHCEGAPNHDVVYINPGTTFEELQQQRIEEIAARGDVTELFPEL